MQEFTAKSSSLFTLCPETPINRAFQGVKSYQRLFTHSSPLFTFLHLFVSADLRFFLRLDA